MVRTVGLLDDGVRIAYSHMVGGREVLTVNHLLFFGMD
jgi:hypothetical protein